ncbi:MAG: hypothetical protein AAF725_11780 [Acidobacteriota bacterium]
MKHLWVRRYSARLVALGFLSASLLQAGAARAAEEPRVVVTAEGSYASWSVEGFEYGLGQLAVTGPRKISHSSIAGAGERLDFRAVDAEGKPVDGVYRWQLRVRSPLGEGVLEELARARLVDDESLVCSLEDEGVLRSFAFSGTFRQVEGRILVPKAGEGDGERPQAAAPNKDFLISDDLIVANHACIGHDCAEGETFAQETLVLKENVIRLRFEDTSTLSSFPSNHWEIEINDAGDGGAERFTIEDVTHLKTPLTIEASAPSGSIYVDSLGQVGFGTSAPTSELHVVSSSTPALRLEQDGGAGFNPQIWDVAGNDLNFAIRDITNDGQPPFQIAAGAPALSITTAADGDVGMGTGSPASDAALHIVRVTKAAQLRVESRDLQTGNADMIYLKNNGKVTLRTVNDQAAKTWDFSNDGNFNISRAGTGVNEMSLNDSGTLTIQGSLRANSGSNVFPDYVFEDDYDLMPLDDLEAFLETNGHLPNVPSAAEVKAEGFIDMTALQLKILEKVEELTLYTLDQEETIRSQAAYIAELTGENRRTSEALEELRERVEALATP